MMQQDTFIQIEGIGQANVLAVARYHQMLGLTKRACVELILNAPSVLKTKLDQLAAKKLSTTLSEVGLPCRVLNQTHYEEADRLSKKSTQDKYEIAAYIHDFSNITEFAGKLAAFTGQSGADIVKTLCSTPATLLGQLSETVANELAKRFTMPGIKLMVSCPKRAKYTLVAYALEDIPRVAQYYAQLGMSRQLNSQGSMQWQAQNLSFDAAHKAWQKASEFNLPMVLQNHDYMRFDISLLTETSSAQDTQSYKTLSEILRDICKIPEALHQKLLTRLPIVIGRCMDYEQTQSLLSSLHECGAQAEAGLISSNRFELYLSDCSLEDQARIAQLCRTFMLKEAKFAKVDAQAYVLPINGNMHQAKWLQHECGLMHLKCQIRRT